MHAHPAGRDSVINCAERLEPAAARSKVRIFRGDNKMHNRRRFLTLFIALCLVSTLSAQEFRATISGRILDASGAAVPATVTVINTETNIENIVKAESTGDFTVPFLTPGRYTLAAEAPGFKKYLQRGITLEVSQKAALTIRLEIGTQTQSIEVVAASQLVDSESAGRGQDISAELVSELPLNFRNPYGLITLMPGVQFRGNQSWIRAFDGAASTAWSMNGGQIGVNEILIDGATNTTQGGSGTGTGLGFVPTVDSVTEIKVQTSSFDASVGRSSGGVSSLVTKTGSNALHGTLYEYYKRDWMDANSFHNKSQGTPIPKQQHFLDQYGGEIDGPVFIPKIYNGRNKTFFTFSYEKYREGTPNQVIQSFPAPEFLNGDFSKLQDNTGKKITIYDPLTGVSDPANTVGLGWTRQPFAGNVIPKTRLDPVALKISSYYPAPNGCVTPNSAYSQNNFCLADTDLDNYHNILIKIDHNLSAKHHIFFRYGGYNRDENRLTNGIVGPGESGQQPFARISNSAIADWVGTITPTLIVNVHGSFTRFIETSYGRSNVGFDIAGKLGLPAGLIKTLPTGTDFGVYSTGLAGLGRGRSFNADNNYQLAGSLTKIWRSHTFRAGMDLRQYNFLIENSGNIFSVSADGSFTQQYYNTSASPTPTGYTYASFLLGAVTGSINLPVYPWYKQLYLSPYLQDDWKVSSKLTLNLGLRWDANLPGHEKHDRLSVGFDPTTVSPLAAQVDPALFPYGNSALKGGLRFAGVGGAPLTGYDAYYKTVQARFGAAYKLTEKIVIRGGYGVYYSPLGSGYEQRPGFTQSTNYTSSTDNNRTPLLHLSDPFPVTSLLPLGYQPVVGAAKGLLTNVGNNLGVYNRSAQLPRTDQYSFGMQMSVTPNSVLDITLGGSRGKNLEMTGIGYNLPSLAFRKQCNAWEGGTANFCDATVPNPFLNVPAFVGNSFYTSTSLSRYSLARPYPQFNGDISPGGDNHGKTWYNSAQINYKYRTRGGLNIITNYTFSKWTQRSGYSDPFTGAINQGIAPADQTHQIKFITVYQLPFGKGKRFLTKANKLVDGVLGGWEVNDSYIVHSGEPINFPTNALMLRDVWNKNVNWNDQQPSLWSRNYCVFQTNGDGTLAKTSNTVQANCPQLTNALTGALTPDFSKYDWSVAPRYAPGVNTPQNGQHRLPRVTTMDASLNKTLKVTERFRGQIRIEAFNVMNHFAVTQTNVDTGPTSTNFGTITPSGLGNASTFPRTVQLGFKLIW